MRLSTIADGYHCFVVSTFQVLSSGCFELYSMMLLTVATLLCNKTPECISPIRL